MKRISRYELRVSRYAIMNGFTKKSVGTLTLGEKLKKLRGNRRISLGEVSRITQVQVKYLEHLENGDYDKLPADVYVRGFLRSYADFLNVDERILIRLYEKEKGIRKNLRKNEWNEKNRIKPVNISSFVFTPKKIVVSFGGFLILAGLFFLYREIGSFASTPRLVVLSPKNNSDIESNSVFVEGATDKDALLFINDQQVLVGDEGKFKESLTLQPGVNVINVKAINKFNKESIETLNIRSKYHSENQTDGQGSSQQNENGAETKADEKKSGITLELKVDPGPVWVAVEADGKQVFSGTMLSGVTQTFTAKDKIMISSGKGNATFVKFNGEESGVLAENSGSVKGIIFTPEGRNETTVDK